MADSIIIGSLRNKRAELAGELALAERLVSKLRGDIASVDATLCIFDPEQKPATIKAKRKRATTPRFQPGELSRCLLAVLRNARQPMTVRELAEAVAVARSMDDSPKAIAALVANVRAALSRPREGLLRETDGDVYRWRLAD